MLKCSECKAWERKADDPNWGLCKRRAPQAVIASKVNGIEYQIVWPLTGKDDSCCEGVK